MRGWSWLWLVLVWGLVHCGNDVGVAPDGQGGADVVGPDAWEGDSAGGAGDCATLSCPPAGACQSGPECVDGECVYAPLDGIACDDGDPCTENDRCEAGTCVAGESLCGFAPEPTCDGDVRVSVTPLYACDGGLCGGEEQRTQCALGCEAGECVGDPCAGVVCDAPPSACHQATGRCVQGSCRYEVMEGAACQDGDACTENDRCNAQGECVGEVMECDERPASVCKDASTLRVYGAVGVCVDGGCEYEAQEVACEGGCEQGACVVDPCAGVQCATPPNTCYAAAGECVDGLCVYEYNDGARCAGGDDACASGWSCHRGECVAEPMRCLTPGPAVCRDATRLEIPGGAGWCEAGSCQYEVEVVVCDFGCEQGACVGDPCAGVLCETPPAPHCAGANTAVTYLESGWCQGGSCQYDAVQTPCVHGCQAGACVPPTGVVISELLYDTEGFPDDEAFIELHGPANMEASGLVLKAVNGTGGAIYTTIALQGAFNADGFFVVAYPDSEAAQVAQMVLKKADLQNGPDSVQLWYGEHLLDALAYGDFGPGDVFAGEGAAAPKTPVGMSLQRNHVFADTDNNAADFHIGVPTPGAAAPVCAVAGAGCDCVHGESRPCEDGLGACEVGEQLCEAGVWGPCVGEAIEGCEGDNPFAEGACEGVSYSTADLLALLDGATEIELAAARMVEETRDCETCPWNDDADEASLKCLQMSGGIMTSWVYMNPEVVLGVMMVQGTPQVFLRDVKYVSAPTNRRMLYAAPFDLLDKRTIYLRNTPRSDPYYYDPVSYPFDETGITLGDGCARWEGLAPRSLGPVDKRYGILFRW